MPDHACLWVYRARVSRIIDGDSIRMQLDLGISVHTTQAIRVKDVDAPEIFSGTNKVAGQAAKSYVVEWFATYNDGSEWPFLVRTYKDKQSFNRYVADIRSIDGRDLATDLVTAGHAVRV